MENVERARERRAANWISSTCSELISSIKKLFPSLTVEHQPEAKYDNCTAAFHLSPALSILLFWSYRESFYAEQWKKSGAFWDTPNWQGPQQAENWVSYIKIRVASGQPVLRNWGWKQKIPDMQKRCTRNFRRCKFAQKWGCSCSWAVCNIVTRDRPWAAAGRDPCRPYVHTTQII